MSKQPKTISFSIDPTHPGCVPGTLQLLDYVSDTVIYPDAAEIVMYMKTVAYVLSNSYHLHECFPCPLCPAIFAYATAQYSDGEWMWFGHTIHYVEHHHVLLPEEFVQRVRELNYRPRPTRREYVENARALQEKRHPPAE
ncbi:hypothetical protein [Tuwongella immobilis]|uniref:hypothetical protein n=1 Tax=Tuwongella immobilis TaxID=692036 RepID=UPI0013A6A129|nr:hypothetical protein [Tuwongella immobilis]